jgi:hypothetical protein
MNYKKVEGNPSIVRDTNSYAIINTNKEEYSKYIMKRNKEKSQLSELNNLKNDVKEIKLLLEMLLEQKHGHN